MSRGTRPHGPSASSHISRRRPGEGSIDWVSRRKFFRGRFRSKGKATITVYAKTRLLCEQKLIAARNGGIMAEWEWSMKVRLLRGLRGSLWTYLQRRISDLEDRHGTA